MSVKKNGVGRGKNISDVVDWQYRYNEDHNDTKITFPGAYKKDQKVLALMRDNIEWRLAEIYDVREAKFFNEEVDDNDEIAMQIWDEIPVMEHPKIASKQQNKQEYLRQFIEEIKEKQKNQREKMNDGGQDEDFSLEQIEKDMAKNMRYEYYIHYLGIDRRNDRWVTEQFLKIDHEEVKRLEKEINMEEEKKKEINTLEREKMYLFNDENLGMNEKDVQEFTNNTKLKTVESIQFGKNWLETWYFTPLPKEYRTKCLYICDFCLFFCVHKREFMRHAMRCEVRHPPGDEIYRDNEISFFEVNAS